MLMMPCVVALATALSAILGPMCVPPVSERRIPGGGTHLVYLPFTQDLASCQPIPNESYGTLSVNPPPTEYPAEEHADLNLALRGFTLVGAYEGLVDYDGATDPKAPRLGTLFAEQRVPGFRAVYQVYDWSWACNCRGRVITSPVVTLATLTVMPGETIHVPASGYSIGSGYEALVLYANSERITLKYTRDDDVIRGYTVHLEGLCVEPALLELYHTLDAAGRVRLPALRAGQPVGRARSFEIGVAIRDNGAFMDPRSRKDWWQAG